MTSRLTVVRDSGEWAEWYARSGTKSSFNVLFFYLPGCGACQIYEPIKQEMVRTWSLLDRTDMAFVSIDITKAVTNQDVQLRKLCDIFAIKSVPSTIMTHSFESPLVLQHFKWYPILRTETKTAFAALYEVLYAQRHWKEKDKVTDRQKDLLRLAGEGDSATFASTVAKLV